MTADEIIAARRARVIEVVDARGRTIGVRRMGPSGQIRILEATDDASELVPLLCAAAVTFIEDNGVRRTLPSDISEPILWSVASALGADGLAAVSYALWQHAAGPAGGPPCFDPFRPFAYVPGAVFGGSPSWRPTVPLFKPATISPLFCKL